MRIFVTGSQGQVAGALREAAAAKGIELHAIGRPALDIRNATTINAALETVRPDLIVNAGAYTAVDLAETDAEDAFALNAQGAENVARAARSAGIPLLHLSTDYVFDGTQENPYTENDKPQPQSVYGASKWEGEKRVAATHPQHVILRTGWVFAPKGKNFVRTMLRVAKAGGKLRVVDDQYGNPTFAGDIADGILALAGKILGPEHRNDWGVFHMTADGDASWCGFAGAIFEESQNLGGPTAPVTAITTADYPTPAKRPHNSRLNSVKLQSTYGIRLPHWRQGLNRCMRAIASGQWDVS